MQPGNFRATVWWIVGVFCVAHAKKICEGMVDFWWSLDAAGKFNHVAMVDFWCFGIAHAKKVHHGMVGFG